MGNELPVIVQVFGLILGSSLILGGAVMIFYATKTQRWPTTNGVITESEVEHVRTKHNGKISHSWRPVVKYKYEVNGEELSGNRLRLFSGNYPSPKIAQRVTEEYPEKTRVVVYYNPNKATKSVLLPGIGGSLMAIAGMFIGGVVLIAVIIYLRINGLSA